MQIWLNVPFAEKDRAKKLGCWWSPGHKKWYMINPDSKTLNKLQKWIDPRLLKPHNITKNKGTK